MGSCELGMSWLHGGLRMHTHARNWLSITEKTEEAPAVGTLPDGLTPAHFPSAAERLWGYGCPEQRQYSCS